MLDVPPPIAEPVRIKRGNDRRGAFTLVELLVVIGIIALLIAIILPSLTKARRIAQRTACAAKLQQIMLGAQMHLGDHHGFYPMAGVLPAMLPEELNDNDAVKYDYFSYPFQIEYIPHPYLLYRMIAPITISLATELSAKQAQFVLTNSGAGDAETDDHGFIRYFMCPSQASSTSEFIQLPMLYFVQESTPDGGAASMRYTQAQSYIYNEAALGWADYDPSAQVFNTSLNRGQGQFNAIHQPARTMFAADGLMGSALDSRYSYPPGRGMMTLYNKVGTRPVTMWDAYLSNGSAGDTENFDLHRHDGKINVAFCDDHVETRTIGQNDLSTVFLLAP